MVPHPISNGKVDTLNVLRVTMGDSESEDRLTTLVDSLDLFEEERLSERCELFVDEGKGKESLAVKPRLTM